MSGGDSLDPLDHVNLLRSTRNQVSDLGSLHNSGTETPLETPVQILVPDVRL